jgi:translation elongation factor aEF-1 beta
LKVRDSMGLVAITFKVMPESPETDLKHIADELKTLGDVKQIKEVPIAFGLKMIEVLMTFEDKQGTGDIEGKIRAISGVGEVEAGDVTLL